MKNIFSYLKNIIRSFAKKDDDKLNDIFSDFNTETEIIEYIGKPFVWTADREIKINYNESK